MILVENRMISTHTATKQQYKQIVLPKQLILPPWRLLLWSSCRKCWGSLCWQSTVMKWIRNQRGSYLLDEKEEQECRSKTKLPMRLLRYPWANTRRLKQTLKAKFFLKAVHDEQFSIQHSGRRSCVKNEQRRNCRVLETLPIFTPKLSHLANCCKM